MEYSVTYDNRAIGGECGWMWHFVTKEGVEIKIIEKNVVSFMGSPIPHILGNETNKIFKTYNLCTHVEKCNLKEIFISYITEITQNTSILYSGHEK